jgi:hypothetical protein
MDVWIVPRRDASATVIDNDAGCTCVLRDDGVDDPVMEVDPVCFREGIGQIPWGYSLANTLDDALRSPCGYFSATETTYTGCAIAAVSVSKQFSGVTAYYDSNTRALLGATFGNDSVTAFCPPFGDDRSRPRGGHLGTGVYTAPPECQLPVPRDLCPKDAGADSD